MLELKEEQALSLYLLYKWKFQDGELFFKTDYDFDTSFIRQKFMQESILRNVPTRFPDLVQLMDELSKHKNLGFESVLKEFHRASFEQSDEDKEKYINDNLEMEKKSDEELIRKYIDRYKTDIPSTYTTNYEHLYQLVFSMHESELNNLDLSSAKDRTVFVLEKMSAELAEYIYAYGVQYDSKVLQTVKKKNSMRDELQLFETLFVPLFKNWMISEMDRETLGMVVSNVLLYYSRVKRKLDHLNDIYRILYGDKGTKKVVLMYYVKDKYAQLGNLKMKSISGKGGKVNRTQFLTDLFNTLGYVKQCERDIFDIPFQPDIITENTMKKWIKSKF